jgi:hypothetical protein
VAGHTSAAPIPCEALVMIAVFCIFAISLLLLFIAVSFTFAFISLSPMGSRTFV